MGLFNKMKEPVFLKESSNAEKQLETLRALEPLLNEEGKQLIHEDIKYLEYGIAGEKNIEFELKNSHMPIYILHDVYLVDGDLTAQIDYIVLTRKLCFLIECKNLYGNIEINSNGDFIRTMEFGGRKKKEGIYSPITQNQRHMELFKKMRIDTKNNFLAKYVANKSFTSYNKSIVVLANPKTILDAKYAKKEIKDQVIRTDQLVSYLKEMDKNCKEYACSDTELLQWANACLRLHTEVQKDYTTKYEKYKKNEEKSEINETTEATDCKENNTEKNETSDKLFDVKFRELKEYRLQKSREEKMKPYYIFNDKQLESLILAHPKNKEELQKISGFGPIKAEKYGDDILNILK